MQQRRITPEERREVLERAKQTTVENTQVLVEAIRALLIADGDTFTSPTTFVLNSQAGADYVTRTFEQAIADEVSLLADEPLNACPYSKNTSMCAYNACQVARRCRHPILVADKP